MSSSASSQQQPRIGVAGAAGTGTAGGVGAGTAAGATMAAAASTTTTTTTGGTTLHSEDFQARMGQILDDQDHKRCSEGNHRALLAENLDQLRGLLKVIESDDWKYEKSGSRSGINGGGLAGLFQTDSDV